MQHEYEFKGKKPSETEGSISVAAILSQRMNCFSNDPFRLLKK